MSSAPSPPEVNDPEDGSEKQPISSLIEGVPEEDSGATAASISKLDSADSTKETNSSTASEISFPVRGVDKNDFSCMYPLYWIMPLIQITTWVCLLVLPLMTRRTRLVWLYVVSGMQLLYMIVGSFQIFRAVEAMTKVKETCLRHSELKKKQKSVEADDDDDDEDVLPAKESKPKPMFSHVFILPNYKEPEEMLAETLGCLASHALAHSYTVVLAMENGEEGHEDKANRLAARFKDSFHRVIFTSHVLQEDLDEQRGKASNVSWAARYVSKECELYPERYAITCGYTDEEDGTKCLDNFSTDKVMVHCMDADAQMHSAYTLEIEATARRIMKETPPTKKNSQEPSAGSVTRCIYVAPVMFSRNITEVPWLNRVYDISWAGAAMQNQTTMLKIGIPLSNYSLTLALIEKVDFWDTNAESIAEDLHMFLKCFFKTDGDVRLEPIYVPNNMLCLDTGGGWRSNIHARFVQAERHARAVADFAYTIKHVLSRPKGYHKWITMWQLTVATVFPPVIPFYCALAAPYCQLLHWIHGYYSDPHLHYLLVWSQSFGIMGLIIVMSLILCHDTATRYANTHLYQIPNLTYCQMLTPLPLSFFTVWMYAVVPFAIASLKLINPFAKQGQYVVAQKAGS